jgi:hypothetical protein
LGDPRSCHPATKGDGIFALWEEQCGEEALVTTLMKGAAGNIADATKAAKALKMSNLPP